MESFNQEHPSKRYAHKIPADEIRMNYKTLGHLKDRIFKFAYQHGFVLRPSASVTSLCLKGGLRRLLACVTGFGL